MGISTSLEVPKVLKFLEARNAQTVLDSLKAQTGMTVPKVSAFPKALNVLKPDDF